MQERNDEKIINANTTRWRERRCDKRNKENRGENFDALSVNLITLIVCKGMMDLNWERLKMDV